MADKSMNLITNATIKNATIYTSSGNSVIGPGWMQVLSSTTQGMHPVYSNTFTRPLNLDWEWTVTTNDLLLIEKPKPSKHRARLLEMLPDWMRMSPFRRREAKAGLDDYNNRGKYTKGEDGIYRDEAGKEYTQKLEDVEIEDALLISSKSEGGNYVLLDIDFPVQVIPSSSPGKNHLYIDKVLSDEDMDKLLKVLVEVGLVNEGIYDLQWRPSNELTLRLPWVRKGVDVPFSALNESDQWAAANGQEFQVQQTAWGVYPPSDYWDRPEVDSSDPF